MTHRAESILEAVKTTLTGLTTTGLNVQRGRYYDLTTLPALVIEKGSDNTATERNTAFQDRNLDISITSAIEQAGSVEGTLNQIAAEIYAAMMADITLGLDYVIDVQFTGDSTPSIEVGGDLPIGFMETSFMVSYRHSYTSTEA